MSSLAALLQRMLRPSDGDMPPEYARRILGIELPDSHYTRYTALAKKASVGKLTEAERGEIEALLTATELLAVFKAKARSSLRTQQTVA